MMKKTLASLTSLATLLAIPLIASAQYNNTMQLIIGAGYIVDALIVLAIAIATLSFFWGLAKFIFRLGGEDAVADGKRLMIWGVVALFVLVSIWGLVNFIQGELLPNTSFSPPPLPVLN